MEKERLTDTITDEYGATYSADGKRLINVPFELEGTYSIKPGTEEVCDKAFCCCDGLTEISIPDSVTRIGDEAFWGCEALASIEIPASVTTVGNKAFKFCKSLSPATAAAIRTRFGTTPID